VVGASTVPHKAGGRRWRSMVDAGFPGPLYPIHPSASEILGHKAYRSLRELPAAIDLAVVLVRPDLVPGVIDECAELAVPAVIVITAGFGETGAPGKALEQGLAERLRAAGGRMIGPNCAGLFSASGRVNALGWRVPAGPIAVISQSGNMALTFAQFARDKGLGFSKLITVGNAADVRIPEYVDYLFADPDTKVVVAYLEGFQDAEGRALVDLVRGHPTPKPFIVLKPGETESGRRAALSHTGSLAGRHRVVEAGLRQAGILQVRESEEAWDAAMALALLPPLAHGTVVVISDGGGHATIVCDAADRAGLAVPELSRATRDRLGEILPTRSGIINPVDFAGKVPNETPLQTLWWMWAMLAGIRGAVPEDGAEPDEKRIAELMNRSLMLVTALAPEIGYDNAAAIAKHAHKTGQTLKEAGLELGLVDEATFDRVVKAEDMVGR